MSDEPSTTVAEMAKAALATAFGEWTKLVAEEHLNSVVAAATREAIANVAGEVAKAAAEGLAGPLLTVLLGVADQTSSNVKRLLREPYLTGVREATDALAIRPVSEEDIRLISERIQNADSRLAQAFTLAEGTKDAWRIQSYIALIRGLIASARNANGVAQAEYARVTFILEPKLRLVVDQEARELELQAGNSMGVERGFHGASNAYLATQERIFRTQRTRRELEMLVAFATSQRQAANNT